MDLGLFSFQQISGFQYTSLPVARPFPADSPQNGCPRCPYPPTRGAWVRTGRARREGPSGSCARLTTEASDRCRNSCRWPWNTRTTRSQGTGTNGRCGGRREPRESTGTACVGFWWVSITQVLQRLLEPNVQNSWSSTNLQTVRVGSSWKGHAK